MIKLSGRLQSCAGLVERGAVAADVGTDHGYLALYLLEAGICPFVYASDLREGPLSAARRSAAGTDVSGRIAFVLSDGLTALDMDNIDTVILAGMGGDTIRGILEAEPAVRDGWKQLVLQPQSKTAELRRYLGSQGFHIRREVLSRDGKFLYTAMDVRYDGVLRSFTPGRELVPDMLADDPLYEAYLTREVDRLRRTIRGLEHAASPDRAALSRFQAALAELDTTIEEVSP